MIENDVYVIYYVNIILTYLHASGHMIDLIMLLLLIYSCKGSRNQFNILSGIIDGNTVYGVDENFARSLRTGYGGLLRMNPVFAQYGLHDLLPLKLDTPDEGCTRPNKNMFCFDAGKLVQIQWTFVWELSYVKVAGVSQDEIIHVTGEIRVNEQLVLTCMHTLMAREHNRVTAKLGEINPHWDDETLYQVI